MTQRLKFNAMVSNLAKDGNAIIRDLTPRNAHLLHMVVGVVGETTELRKGIEAGSRKNVIEELGDIEFFLQGIRQECNVQIKGTIETVRSYYPALNSTTGTVHDGVSIGGEMLDHIKKAAIYGKQLSDVRIAELVMLYEDWLSAFYRYNKIDVSEVLAKNMDKLMTGANARYAEGFNNNAAKNRADKLADCISIFVSGYEKQIEIPDTEEKESVTYDFSQMVTLLSESVPALGENEIAIDTILCRYENQELPEVVLSAGGNETIDLVKSPKITVTVCSKANSV